MSTVQHHRILRSASAGDPNRPKPAAAPHNGGRANGVLPQRKFSGQSSNAPRVPPLQLKSLAKPAPPPPRKPTTVTVSYAEPPRPPSPTSRPRPHSPTVQFLERPTSCPPGQQLRVDPPPARLNATPSSASSGPNSPTVHPRSILLRGQSSPSPSGMDADSFACLDPILPRLEVTGSPPSGNLSPAVPWLQEVNPKTPSPPPSPTHGLSLVVPRLVLDDADPIPARIATKGPLLDNDPDIPREFSIALPEVQSTADESWAATIGDNSGSMLMGCGTDSGMNLTLSGAEMDVFIAQMEAVARRPPASAMSPRKPVVKTKSLAAIVQRASADGAFSPTKQAGSSPKRPVSCPSPKPLGSTILKKPADPKKPSDAVTSSHRVVAIAGIVGAVVLSALVFRKEAAAGDSGAVAEPSPAAPPTLLDGHNDSYVLHEVAAGDGRRRRGRRRASSKSPRAARRGRRPRGALAALLFAALALALLAGSAVFWAVVAYAMGRLLAYGLSSHPPPPSSPLRLSPSPQSPVRERS